jgi:hypothetical protein
MLEEEVYRKVAQCDVLACQTENGCRSTQSVSELPGSSLS